MSASSRLIRATVDTNLFVSGVFWANTLPAQLIRAWLTQQFRLVTSTALRVEVTEVLGRPKFARYRLSAARLQTILDALAGAEHAVPLDPLPLRCRDPKDDKFLACALGGHVDYLVTGDTDLHAVNGHPALGDLRIVTVREFLALLGIGP
jgi:putative PIN family toxin of toxin-antitoxin system